MTKVEDSRSHESEELKRYLISVRQLAEWEIKRFEGKLQEKRAKRGLAHLRQLETHIRRREWHAAIRDALTLGHYMGDTTAARGRRTAQDRHLRWNKRADEYYARNPSATLESAAKFVISCERKDGHSVPRLKTVMNRICSPLS